jgi:DNA-binding response OmpR family regulator
MSSDAASILVVDDEPNIRLTLSALLRRAGHTVTVAASGDVAASGEEAVSLFGSQSFDLMLVDLQMPGISGIQVVETIRARGIDTEVIVLTGHGSLESAIEGIHQGIFDYLLKTSDPTHIVERVAAGLTGRARRLRQNNLLSTIGQAVQELSGTNSSPPAEEGSAGGSSAAGTTGHERVVNIGHLTLDTWHQTATLSNRSLNLTPTEFRLLLCLSEHVGQMLSYTQLVRCAQGYETSELEAGELIKPHIHHLRQKIEPDPSTPRFLLNVRGKGYILQID